MILNGIINFYKESGITSFRAVENVKRLLQLKKCGHTGTLDPLAEGVLPICINNATKLFDDLMNKDKEYLVNMKLGIKTDSFDITGKVVKENIHLKPSIEDVEENLSAFIGEINLPIPIFSSVKVKGVRAYKLARKGEDIDCGMRVTNIANIILLKYEYPNAIIQVSCSKGTYIRSLVNSFGEKLGTFATVEGLTRTKNGPFSIRNAFKFEDIQKNKENPSKFITPLNNIFNWPEAVVKNKVVKDVMNGVSPKRGDYTRLVENKAINHFIMDNNENILGIAKWQDATSIPLKIYKVFPNINIK